MARANIGTAGPQGSDPVVFPWRWYWHLPRLAPWLLLALAVVLPRTNRDWRSLLIFIPLLVLILLWRPVTKSVGMAGLSLDESSLFFESLVVGVGLLWLNADQLGRCRRLVRLATSLGIVLLGGLAGLIAHGRISSAEAAPLLIFIVFMGVVLLVALAAARQLVRGRYRPVRFMLYLGMGNVLCTTVGVIIVVLVFETLNGFRGTLNPQSALIEALELGLVLGVCLYAINLPYLLLMFSSPFFRRRLQAWLGAETAS